jgi:hypothetical protein
VAGLFASGRIVDLVLGLVLLEGLLLLAIRHRTGEGVAPAELVAFLLAGAFLMLALRAALTGAAWGWVALWLLAALVAHLSDLRLRWRRRRSSVEDVGR